MEKTVHEICLVCKGERWIADPADGARSKPCPYCDPQGWVVVAPASLGEAAPRANPRSESSRKDP